MKVRLMIVPLGLLVLRGLVLSQALDSMTLATAQGV